MLSSAARLLGNHSGEAERDSGIGLTLFGFIAESVFAFIPEPCSGSSRNVDQHHRGIAFILPRIPQSMANRLNWGKIRCFSGFDSMPGCAMSSSSSFI